MDVRNNVKENIRWIIDNREDGIPANFASSIGVERQNVNNWKSGKSSPNLDVIEVIVTHYDLSLDWFIGGDVSKAPSDYNYALVTLDGDEDD